MSPRKVAGCGWVRGRGRRRAAKPTKSDFGPHLSRFDARSGSERDPFSKSRRLIIIGLAMASISFDRGDRHRARADLGTTPMPRAGHSARRAVAQRSRAGWLKGNYSIPDEGGDPTKGDGRGRAGDPLAAEGRGRDHAPLEPPLPSPPNLQGPLRATALEPFAHIFRGKGGKGEEARASTTDVSGRHQGRCRWPNLGWAQRMAWFADVGRPNPLLETASEHHTAPGAYYKGRQGFPRPS